MNNIKLLKSKHNSFSLIWFIIVILIGCLLTACQPTPKQVVVQNKRDGELEQAIAQTAEPTAQEVVQTNEPSQEPIFIKDISSNASNTVTLEINAEVINNQPPNIPVAKIIPDHFTNDEVERMARAFFSDTQFYKGVHIKSDFDKLILKLQYKISNDEELLKSDHATAGGITDLPTLRKLYQKNLDRLIEDRKNAPDERPALNSFMDDKPCGFADLGDGYMGKIHAWEEKVGFTAFRDDKLKSPSRSLVAGCEPYTQLDIDKADTEFQNARRMSIDMIAKMGINAVLGEAYLIDDPIKGANRQYYVFCFEKVINDSKLDHVLNWRALSYSKGDEDEYAQQREYEELELWVEGDRFVQFKYHWPMQVSKIINESVAINIDYTQAIELAKQHAHVAFIDTYGSYSESKITIDKIELVLIRVKQADSKDYIVIPAWNFYGDWLVKQKIDDGDFKAGEWRLYNYLSEFKGDHPIITINALDGSVN